METQSVDQTKDYNEKVKMGLLLSNLHIKSEKDIFPDGVPSKPELFSIKPKEPKPKTLIDIAFANIQYAWRSGLEYGNKCKGTDFRKSVGPKIYEISSLVGYHSCLVKNLARHWIGNMLEWFFFVSRMAKIWFTRLPMLWHNRQAAFYEMMRKSDPLNAINKAWNEVNFSIATITRSYERVCKSILQKHKMMTHEMVSISSPICFQEEQKVIKCLQEQSSTQNMMNCIDPLDLYKKCVDVHAEKIKL